MAAPARSRTWRSLTLGLGHVCTLTCQAMATPVSGQQMAAKCERGEGPTLRNDTFEYVAYSWERVSLSTTTHVKKNIRRHVVVVLWTPVAWSSRLWMCRRLLTQYNMLLSNLPLKTCKYLFIYYKSLIVTLIVTALAALALKEKMALKYLHTFQVSVLHWSTFYPDSILPLFICSVLTTLYFGDTCLLLLCLKKYRYCSKSSTYCCSLCR